MGTILSGNDKFVGFHVSQAVKEKLRAEAKSIKGEDGEPLSVAELLRRVLEERYAGRP